ncbi:hypothetical protein [Chryseobacterium sp. ON_d1]|uniref:hypothetical protein n=1 Tax=Chryseobacterium sp. ON_d1 TaxID=2583211 RepID=UPI00115A82EC|nr:hypothetical protein [Chryseobacterium sp. ON_d1]GEJ45260.1 hypothetical protein CRS_18680 [Chryseobacterium sp. ON_d1]
MNLSDNILNNLQNLKSKCFLCFCTLDKSNSSKEHVIPKWLFKKFNHNDDGIKLGNHTNLRYKQLTIPACKNCNNSILSQIEEAFISILDNSFKNLSLAEELIIAQWTLKIMLGTILKEMSLEKDIKKVGEKILSFDQVKELLPLFILLHSIFYETELKNRKPWSLFITSFETENYDYHSHSFFKTASFKFGKIGFIITFDDSSFYQIAAQNFEFNKLSDMRFIELTYTFFALRNSETKILISKKELIANKLIISSKKHYHKPKITYNTKYKNTLNYLLNVHKMRFNK